MSKEVLFRTALDFEVKAISHWGSDKDIANIASISYGKEEAPNTEALIKALIVKGHLSPFEHAGITFYMEIPIFVARQLLRYRHISVNEMSRRYTTEERVEFEFYLPSELYINNDFYASDTPPAQIAILQLVEEYRNYIQRGIKPETARIILPVSLMTKMYFTVNIRELMHILNQRLRPEAQREIRYVADMMLGWFSTYFPLTHNYFMETYREGF